MLGLDINKKVYIPSAEIFLNIDLILDAAKIHGVPLHLTVTLRQMYQALIAQGDGEDDYIAIVKQVEISAGLDVESVLKRNQY